MPAPAIVYDYAHFTLDKLDRIVPVAQTHRLDEMDFTLLALECYKEGFVATTILDQDWRVPDPPPPPDELEQPQMLLGMLFMSEVEDDLGNRYASYIRSGSGGGGGEEVLRVHHVYIFEPALHPNARSLKFTATQVDRPQYDADHRAFWSDDRIVGGPWTLQFSLEPNVGRSNQRVSVLPVARQLSVDDISATVTTLEFYIDGFVVNSRLDWAGSGGPFPQPVWHATDDRGGDYGTGNCGGGGDRVDGVVNCWRSYCKFKLEIDPEASELTLRLASFGLRQPVRNEEEDRFDHWEQRRKVDDLGEIRIPLP